MIKVVDFYPQSILGSYPPDLAALGQGRAFAAGYENAGSSLRRRFFLLERGDVVPLGEALQIQLADFFSTGKTRQVCSYQKGILIVNEESLAVLDSFDHSLCLLPIRNSLLADSFGRRRSVVRFSGGKAPSLLLFF